MQFRSIDPNQSALRWVGVVALCAMLGLSACSKEDQQAAADKAETSVEKAADAGKQAFESAKETLSSTTEVAKEKAGEAIEKAKEVVESTADKAEEMAKQAADSVKEAADSAASSSVEKAESAASAAGEMVDSAKSKAGEVATSAAGKAESMTESATGAAKDAAQKAKEKAQDAVQTAVDKTSDAGDAATGKVAATAAAAAAAAATTSGPSASDAATKAVSGAPIKAAWVYVGPVGDGGWSFAHDNGRKLAQAAMGADMVSTFVESVPESADAERVLRDLATQGNRIIFGTTFGYMESMRKLSREFPEIKWEHATGYKTTDNMRTYDARTYQGAYMAGVVAGGMTQSRTLGVVGSIPIPEVIRNINSFTLGAQSVNPDITTKVVWVNKWFDPPRETEAAQSLIDQGADVLFQNTDSAAVLQTAEKAGKYAFGWDSDMTSYGPKAHLASAVINWGPYYTMAMKQVADDSWKTGSAWWGVREGAIDLVSISDKVPADLRAKVEGVKAGLKGGIFKIWKGPITDTTGKEVLAQGVVADDKFLGGINFYVKGVDGQVPGGK